MSFKAHTIGTDPNFCKREFEKCYDESAMLSFGCVLLCVCTMFVWGMPLFVELVNVGILTIICELFCVII